MSSFWKVFVGVAVTLVVAGGGTYYYMSQKLENEKSNLQSQITELNKQIDDLQATETTTDSTDDSTTTETDETAGWKTYASSNIGFSFKYPNSWILTSEQSDDSAIIFAKYADTETGGMYQGSVKDIYIKVYEASAVSLRDWLITKYKIADTELSNYSVGKEIAMGQISGYLSDTGCCGGFDKSYVVNKGDHIFILGTTYEKYEDTLGEIAPTFSFTK